MQAIPEGSWWWWGFLYLDCTNVNIFVDTLYHSIARCYHWRGMGKGYAGSLCITSNCTWIYNDLKIRHVINTSVGAECNSAQKLIFTVLCYGRLNMCGFWSVRSPKMRAWDCSLRFQLYEWHKMNERWNRKFKKISMDARPVRLDCNLIEAT